MIDIVMTSDVAFDDALGRIRGRFDALEKTAGAEQLAQSPAESVRQIVNAVRQRGDDALIECTRQFDGCTLTPETLRVSDDEIEHAYELVPAELIDAIRAAIENVSKYQQHILLTAPDDFAPEGVTIRTRYEPLASVGVYVPGGLGAYPSTLIMAAVPDGAGDVRHEEFLVAPGVTVGVPGTDITLKAVEFIGHFSYDIETRTAAPASPFHRNPAVLVQVAEGGRALGEEWLFVGIRGHADGFGLPVRLFLLDYRPDFNAGLTRFQVSYQPGTPVMYAGFGAISVGIVLLFWFRPGPTGTGAIGEGASDRGRSAESGAAQSRGRGAGHRTAQDRVRDDAGRRPAGSGTEPRRGQGQGV